ncbi:MAG TPA: DUF4399 domain-containing protein [Chitinophagaceae bacterium]|nr:DUF4399 domain-containing protein [Chitinophagaceae bacterium]
MKKIIGIPVLFLLGLYACNSGSSSENSSADTTASKMADTSQAMATMPSADTLPAVPADAKVFFRNLKNGATVTSPVKIEMGVADMSVDSSGKVRPQSGHFHLLIDAGDSTPKGIVIGKDSTHIHYGNAQKEATINLSPGKHTLALQFADGIHRSYGSQLSTAITVTVK